MSDSPVVAAAFGTVLEAQAFVNRLDAEEIPAHVVDGEAGTTLGYLGAAVGGIKVVVLPRHLERATQMLGELRGEQQWGQTFGDESEWTCASCKAAVPGEHDVCWSCGAARTGDEMAAFEPVAPEDRTVGEAASEIQQLASHRAWDAEVRGASRHARRPWLVLLLFLMGPFALLPLLALLLLQPDGGGRTEERRADVGTALWGCLCMLVAAAALWVWHNGLPF